MLSPKDNVTFSTLALRIAPFSLMRFTEISNWVSCVFGKGSNLKVFVTSVAESGVEGNDLEMGARAPIKKKNLRVSSMRPFKGPRQGCTRPSENPLHTSKHDFSQLERGPS